MANTILDKLKKELDNMAGEIDNLKRALTDIRIDEKDGLPVVGGLLERVRPLESMKYDMMELRRKVARSAMGNRQALRNLDRVATSQHAEDSIPAALILLRTLIRAKQTQEQAIDERNPALYDRLGTTLDNAADTVREVAKQLSK